MNDIIARLVQEGVSAQLVADVVTAIASAKARAGRASHMERRRELAQDWANLLPDGLLHAGTVLRGRRRQETAMTTLESGARAICKLDGNPAEARFEGRPMWESYLPEVRAMLAGMREHAPEGVDSDAWLAMIDSAVAEGSDLG